MNDVHRDVVQIIEEFVAHYNPIKDIQADITIRYSWVNHFIIMFRIYTMMNHSDLNTMELLNESDYD